MSLYTNTQPFSCISKDGKPVISSPGTTFKLICYDSFGVHVEVLDESREKMSFSINLDVFKTVFKEVDL